MRELKFRAWDKKWKRWIDPARIDIRGDGECDFTRHDEKTGDDIETTTNKDPNICLMQYTGLKDKNGRDIYEGDILKVWNDLYSDDRFAYRGEVRWDSEICGWARGNYSLPMANKSGGTEQCEVIGNIYEVSG